MSKRRSIKSLFALLFIFLFPLVGSCLLYGYHEYFQLKTTNHGVLINPPLPASFLVDNIQPKAWQILYVPSSPCDDHCVSTSKQLSQLKKLFGKDADRIRLVELNLASEAAKQLETALTSHLSQTISIRQKIYLVDPLGNIFMYYSENANLLDIYKDLKHIMGVSQIG